MDANAAAHTLFEKPLLEERSRGAAPGVPPHCDKNWRNICEH